MRRISSLVVCLSLLVMFTGCKQDEPQNRSNANRSKTTAKDSPANNTVKPDEGHSDGNGEEAHGHAHDEVSIGTATLGDLTIELAQGHGMVEAGKEGHLVVKLPYNDKGATIVRAWIGTDDRTMSMVCKGEYAPSHDDYDIHAVAPDPLPDDAMWWIEIEKPDGTKLIGNARPLIN